MIDLKHNGVEISKISYEEFCTFLARLGNSEKALFDAKIFKTKLKIYGLYAKQINEIVKYLQKNENNIFSYPTGECFEIALIQGLLIAKDSKLELNIKKQIFNKWADRIDNWALCDMVVSKFFITQSNKNAIFSYAIELCKNKKEFIARCGIVLCMKYISSPYIYEILTAFDTIEYGRFYVDMAVAWFCATALIDYRNDVVSFLLKSKKINSFTLNKTCQKACESFRISDDDKAFLKKVIRKKA